MKDKDGINIKFPKRNCKECGLYPCFEGIKNLKCNCAKYGCTLYKDKK